MTQNIAALSYIESNSIRNRYCEIFLTAATDNNWSVELNGTDQNGQLVLPKFMTVNNLQSSSQCTVYINGLPNIVSPFTRATFVLVSPFGKINVAIIQDCSIIFAEKDLGIPDEQNQQASSATATGGGGGGGAVQYPINVTVGSNTQSAGKSGTITQYGYNSIAVAPFATFGSVNTGVYKTYTVNGMYWADYTQKTTLQLSGNQVGIAQPVLTKSGVDQVLGAGTYDSGHNVTNFTSVAAVPNPFNGGNASVAAMVLT